MAPKINPNAEPIKLKISLDDMPYPLYRTCLVAENISMERLHHIIQNIMMWDQFDSYLFLNDKSKPKFGVGPSNAKVNLEKGKMSTPTRTYLKKKFMDNNNCSPFYYFYYRPQSEWWHTITFEEITPEDRKIFKGRSILLESSGNCPPDEVGGPEGFRSFLEIVDNPGHPLNKYLRELATWNLHNVDPQLLDYDDLNSLQEYLTEYEDELFEVYE
ncbi:IS1096 element passenger TnpR family protein [Litoribacter populi]|uniref:IS1096 element passenger TnpR family protein n=1 Tax=Litoribacter populi TaxID=2598460 RepID=UPI00117CABB9|nr:plasmid pRiA4b ORF-3 family protein [Litoribacter populi]